MHKGGFMFCEKCGEKRLGNVSTCLSCGNPFPVETDDSATLEKEYVQSETIGNITINGSDLQWLYAFSFWKNPTILFTTAKVLLISLFIPTILMFIITLENGLIEAITISAMILAYGALLLGTLLILAYLMIGILYGGKYYVIFKMDNDGINHIQLQKQFKKAEALGFLTSLVGVSTGNLTAGGAGLMAASKQSLYTSFKKVKSIKVNKKRNTIFLNESMTRNQIYAENVDFDFILNRILECCPKNVKVKTK